MRKNKRIINTEYKFINDASNIINILFIYELLSHYFVLIDFFFLFQPYHMACRLLVPQPEIKHMSPAVEAQSPNNWIAREFPCLDSFTNTELYQWKKEGKNGEPHFAIRESRISWWLAKKPPIHSLYPGSESNRQSGPN